MGYSRVTQGRVDPLLTNISLKYTNEGFIHDKVWPLVQTSEDSGEIGKYGKDSFRVYLSKRNINDETAHRISWELEDPSTYKIDYHDLEDYMSDIEAGQYQKPFDANQDSLLAVESARDMVMESGMASLFGNASILTNTSTPANLWDTDLGDPIQDIETAIQAIRVKIGRKPNKAVTNSVVLSKIKSNPNIINRIGGIKMSITDQDVINIIKSETGLKEVYVGESLQLTSEKGQTDALGELWQDDFVVYYAPDKSSLRTPSMGYRIVNNTESTRFLKKMNIKLNGRGMDKRVTLRRHHNDVGDIVKVDWNYTDKLLDADCAYLLNQVIT